jgi:hypothetical protein
VQDRGDRTRRRGGGDAVLAPPLLDLAPPHVGCVRRSATTCASSTAAVWVGEVCGRRERSASPASRSRSQRASHL